MFEGYIPTTIKGSMTTTPADFLIDREGIIQVAHCGRDEGDHLPFDAVKEFSLK
jgi:peroxiredoxin Q/BCP